MQLMEVSVQFQVPSSFAVRNRDLSIREDCDDELLAEKTAIHMKFLLKEMFL
jgi:hypothetical protein